MPGRPFKRAEARQAHKETASVVIDGKTHLAPHEAVAFLKVTYPTLKRWANTAVGCPWLNGEALRTEKHPTAYSRKITYFLKEDLTRVRDAKCKRVQVPEYPGLTNLHDAYEQLGVSRRTLQRIAKSHVPPVRIVEKNAKSTNGWAHPKAYISTEFVEEMKAARKSPPVPADRMTVAEAAKELKRKTVTIHKYAREGRLDVVLGKKLVDAAPRGDDSPRLSYRRKATLVLRKSVELLKRELLGLPMAEPSEAPEAQKETPKKPKRRGRPKGSTDPYAAERNRLMKEEWASGKFKSIADLARNHKVDRGNASKILNGR